MYLHPNSCRTPLRDRRADSSWATESESEASGSSSLVSPAQSRRRVAHGLPTGHPHRRRKVSAPPELQPHFSGPSPHAHNAHAHNIQGNGGANPDHVHTSANPEYTLNFPGQTQLSASFCSGSDSGVPSEYSSWAAPVSGVIRHDAFSPNENHTLPPDSIDDLAGQPQTNDHQEISFYQSDSDCESLDGLQAPHGCRKSAAGSGMNNQGYVHTEPTPVVLPVGSPPPLIRASTETNMASPPPSAVGSPVNYGQGRRHSMVLQLNLQGAAPQVAGLPGNSRGRSVSMVSLNANQPVPNMYPNLHDTQSIYSEVGYGSPAGFSGGHHSGSQGSIAGGGLKIVESQQALVNCHTDGVCTHPDAHDPQEPQPTEEGEKKSRFQLTLSKNLSIMYAVFLVMLGIVIYLADTFSGHDSAMAEGFNVFLIVAQLLWLFYVHVDVRRYVNLISRTLDEAKTKQVNKDDQVHLEPTGDGQYQLRINVPEAPRTIPQHYGFTSGGHGGSLYLKIGATVFCLGYLIHTGLNLGQKILYLTEEDPVFDNCTCTTDVIMSVLQPVYAFYQLFFIFKYSNLIINRRLVLSRFGIMHCIASSLCFWIYTILQETLQAIFLKKSSEKNYSSDTTTAAQLISGGGDEDDSDEMEDDDTQQYVGRKFTAAAASSWSINYGCEKDTHLSSMINATTPYLFPFSIEFSILMVGLWILLWENIGKFDRHTHIPSVEVTYEEDNTKTLTSNLIIYVDCHASNRGLFAGLLMTVATVISIILFFIFSASEDSKQLGIYVNGISEVLLLTCMLFTAIVAYNSIRILDIIKHKISNVDDILLYVCLPCIFLYAFLSMVPAINGGLVLSTAVSILQVCQVILQTALICDGLRRCSNAQSLQHKKPGREVITYLVVTNVAMWLLQTFEIKSEEGNSALYDFYGKELWTLLSHLTLPLALFYRFHSSVCLADMWKASYEAEESH
ncbi:proton channel OtopLc-like isoform X3 [Homarus americanus]|uniref:proton channel OtopLc-like isoform X3 n=1 Tax=Homarus americanus TaxID=6706 RepID=UPI001C47ED3A|nr:proton channel OtopLc-like isoform X3 [Homarus americanus]